MKITRRSRRTWALGALAVAVAAVGCNALTGLDQNFHEVTCLGASCPHGGSSVSSGGSGGATCSAGRTATTGTGASTGTGSTPLGGCPTTAGTTASTSGSTSTGTTGGSTPVDAGNEPGCTACNTQVLNAAGPFCNAGACDYASCLAGYADLDGDRANGCESTLPSGVPEAASLVLWLRGEDWNGTTWTDSSPGGRNAVTYYGTVGTSTLHGHPVAAFDGNGVLLIDTGFPAWFGVSVFALMNAPDTSGALIALGTSFNNIPCVSVAPFGTPDCVDYNMLRFDAAMNLEQCDPNIGTCWQASGASTAGAGWVRVGAILSPGVSPSYHVYANGSDEGALGHNMPYPYPAPWPTPRKDTIVGWGYSLSALFSGSIAEMIIYNAPLSDASRLAVDAYLKTKWGL